MGIQTHELLISTLARPRICRDERAKPIRASSRRCASRDPVGSGTLPTVLCSILRRGVEPGKSLSN